jgi:hypothetical protein
MFYSFIMTMLLTNYSSFTAMAPHCDYLMHPVCGIKLRTAPEGFQNEK